MNDAPSFTKGANQTVAEDSGAASVAAWATAISAGPSNESGQTVDFLVSNDNNGLFGTQPAISPAGTLTYTPAANASGSATVTVRIHDNAGTANGGADTSAPQTFTITVTAVNDSPTAGSDSASTPVNTPVTINPLGNDNAGPGESGQALTITGKTNGTSGTVTFTATSVTYTPAVDFVGTDSFTYTVCDNGSPSLCATGTVNMTVTPVTSGLLSDVITTDSEFQRIDGFDVLFANGTGSTKQLRATNPGSFHYELDLRNETGVTMHVRGKPLPNIVQNGVSIRDRNGASVAVIVTVPSLPTNVGTPIPGSAAGYTNAGTPAFRLSGWRPVRANPDDRSDLMPMTVSWANPANGDCLAASVAWTVGTPSSGALVKCLKIEGLEIPRHRKARVHLNFEFAPRGTTAGRRTRSRCSGPASRSRRRPRSRSTRTSRSRRWPARSTPGTRRPASSARASRSPRSAGSSSTGPAPASTARP